MKTKTISRSFWLSIAFVCLSNSAQAGFIEICKDSLPAGTLTGVFSFTVGGQSGVFVPAGACTLPFVLPDGTAEITEIFQAGSVLSDVFTFPDERLVSFDLIMSTATVQIMAGDISNQTVVVFTNTAIPEPGTAWLLGSGLTLWTLRKKLVKRRFYAALQNVENSLVRRA